MPYLICHLAINAKDDYLSFYCVNRLSSCHQLDERECLGCDTCGDTAETLTVHTWGNPGEAHITFRVARLFTVMWISSGSRASYSTLTFQLWDVCEDGAHVKWHVGLNGAANNNPPHHWAFEYRLPNIIKLAFVCKWTETGTKGFHDKINQC